MTQYQANIQLFTDHARTALRHAQLGDRRLAIIHLDLAYRFQAAAIAFASA